MEFDLSEIDVVAPNLNRRLSGVTSTIVRLVPLQREHIGIVSFGVGLPDGFPKLSMLQLIKLGWTRPKKSGTRVWHARRNVEMLLGLFLKHVLRHKYKMLFTSASQREHSAYSRWLIRQMDHVIATSKATKTYLKVPASVVYHGINTAEFYPVDDKSKLKKELGLPDLKFAGCIGRIRAQKGTDVFVDSMLKLLPDRPGWGAVVLGRATEQYVGFLSDLKRKVREAGLEERILFPDEVPVDQVFKWYQALDLFIAPQRWEGFGLTPLEAMACGVPSIATTVGAFPELIIEGETGTLIEPGHVDLMVAESGNLMDDDPRRDQMGRTSRKHMETNFDISVEMNNLVSIYRKLLDNLA